MVDLYYQLVGRKWGTMRKRYRVLLLATIVAAVIVPVGFALSLEPAKPRPAMPITQPVVDDATPAKITPILLDVSQHTSVLRPMLPVQTEVPDSANLFLLGTILIGLAIAVRRVS